MCILTWVNRAKLNLWYIHVSLKLVLIMDLQWIIAVTCQCLPTGQVIKANSRGKCSLKCICLSCMMADMMGVQQSTLIHVQLKINSILPWLPREFSHAPKELFSPKARIPKFWLTKIEFFYFPLDAFLDWVAPCKPQYCTLLFSYFTRYFYTIKK